MTNSITQQPATMRTDHLKDLLCLVEEAGMIDRCGQLYVAEMTRAFGHVFRACLALELAIDGPQAGVVEAVLARLCLFGIHSLGILDVRDAQGLDLVRGHDSELDLLDRLDGRTRVRKRKVRHLQGRFRLVRKWKRSRV